MRGARQRRRGTPCGASATAWRTSLCMRRCVGGRGSVGVPPLSLLRFVVGVAGTGGGTWQGWGGSLAHQRVVARVGVPACVCRLAARAAGGGDVRRQLGLVWEVQPGSQRASRTHPFPHPAGLPCLGAGREGPARGGGTACAAQHRRAAPGGAAAAHHAHRLSTGAQHTTQKRQKAVVRPAAASSSPPTLSVPPCPASPLCDTSPPQRMNTCLPPGPLNAQSAFPTHLPNQTRPPLSRLPVGTTPHHSNAPCLRPLSPGRFCQSSTPPSSVPLSSQI